MVSPQPLTPSTAYGHVRRELAEKKRDEWDKATTVTRVVPVNHELQIDADGRSSVFPRAASGPDHFY